MRLKVFRAPTVAAAMAQVRSELGDDALILSTRRTGAGVEITAALEFLPKQVGPQPPAAILPPADPELLASLRWHRVPEDLAATLAVTDPEAALGRTLPFGSLSFEPGAAPVLLTGPPGAGKSLTVAKLATRLVLAGRTPMVVSADAQRAGAAEQLGAFTRLLGIPLLVATDALSLSRALSRRQDGAPALIDTAGINPFDPAEQAGIASLAAASGGVSALVLPAGLDVSEASDMAAAFRAAGASALVATRLDTSRRLGSVLAAAASGLPLTEGGIGPGVADGLAPLTPAFLAGRLAGPPRKVAA